MYPLDYGPIINAPLYFCFKNKLISTLSSTVCIDSTPFKSSTIIVCLKRYMTCTLRCWLSIKPSIITQGWSHLPRLQFASNHK